MAERRRCPHRRIVPAQLVCFPEWRTEVSAPHEQGLTGELILLYIQFVLK